MTPSPVCVMAASVCLVSVAWAASDSRVGMLFRPPLGEMTALSLDGQLVAYTRPAGRNLTIEIINLEYPASTQRVRVGPTSRLALLREQPPMQLRFLRWATDRRLIYAPVERIEPLPPVTANDGQLVANPDGPAIVSPILAVDGDGEHHAGLIDADHFQELPDDAVQTLADLLRTTGEIQATRSESVRWRMPHLDILGFDPGNRERLVIRTRGGYKAPAQYLVDIRTAHVEEVLNVLSEPPREPQIFDWFRRTIVGERTAAARAATTWRDEELGRVQRELDAKFPRRVVEILDWSEPRLRVLFRVTGGRDPGRVFVFQRPEDLVVEVFRRAPWLPAAELSETRFFAFEAPDGAPLSGHLTWPERTSVHPPPLLLILPSGFPGGPQPDFDPESQVFADLGFAVARLNHRGVAGVRAEDHVALRAAVDRVSVEDAQAALEWLATRMPERPFDRNRVATLGRGFGGYLAVRALQLQPAVFRCAIAIDAPLDPHRWLRPAEAGAAAPPAGAVGGIPVALLDPETSNWKELSVVDQVEALTNPVMFLVEPGRSPVVDAATSEVRRRLRELGRTPGHLEIDADFSAGQPKARAAVYRSLAKFLQAHLPDFDATKAGPVAEGVE